MTRTATEFGTAVHAMAKLVVWEHRIGARPTEPELVPFADAIRGFMEKHVYTPINTELTLVSQHERVGGTLDLYCQLRDGSYAVVDWKTSAQLSREHGLQTVLYMLLLMRAGREVNRRLVVRLKKDKPGEWYVREFLDHEADAKAARAAVELWWWQNALKMAKRIEAG